MKKHIFFMVLLLFALTLLAACSALQLPWSGQKTEQTTQDSAAAFDPANIAVDMKLAMGTLQLEGTDLAVTAQQAKDLLPLWKAVKSLSTSQTASSDEIQALYRQIEETMAPEQVQAIKEMKLDQAALNVLAEKLGVEIPQFGAQGSPANLSEDERATRIAQYQAQNPGAVPGSGDGPGSGAGFMPPPEASGQASVQRTPGAGAGRRTGGLNLIFIDPLIQLLEERANS